MYCGDKMGITGNGNGGNDQQPAGPGCGCIEDEIIFKNTSKEDFKFWLMIATAVFAFIAITK